MGKTRRQYYREPLLQGTRDGSLRKLDIGIVVVGWLLNVPLTCECVSGTEILQRLEESNTGNPHCRRLEMGKTRKWEYREPSLQEPRNGGD